MEIADNDDARWPPHVNDLNIAHFTKEDIKPPPPPPPPPRPENNYNMPARRRVKHRPPDTNTATVDLEDAEFDDPEYLELLKIYDESDSDTEKDSFMRDRDSKSSSQTTPLLTQGAVYFLLIGCVGFFILFVNYYNVKQLERLKQEYGLDDKKPEPEFWWKKSLIYHIYVQSYKDSDGDGIGDLTGIRQHIDHLQYLHIDAVLLSPIFDSPMVDQGKDVADFMTINPKFGTMDIFRDLVEELHLLGIKVILEFLPNHTSKQHKWFRQSRKGGKNNEYKNYYVWHNGNRLPNGTLEPPSNWISKYGDSAWTWDNQRKQYYYHYYHDSMPDLNHREPHVRDEFSKIFVFWLEKGVDGVLADGVYALFESEELILDEPLSEKEETPQSHHDSLDHIFTEDQPEIHEYLGSWHDAVEAYGMKHKKKIPFMIYVEDTSLGDMAKYYYTGADLPLTPALISLHNECGGVCVHDIIDAWVSHVPSDSDVVWMLSNAEFGRVTKGRGSQYQNLYNMLVMLLPGIVISYYGEEIGMEPVSIPQSDMRDILSKSQQPGTGVSMSRDPSRTPMQWTNQEHAGFTDGDSPWLPIHTNHPHINVETQRNDPTISSPLQLYQRLATLRKYPSFQHGKIQYSVVTENVFSFMRFAKDNAPYLIVLNFGDTAVIEDFALSAGVQFGKVVAHARGKVTGGNITEGEKTNLAHLKLAPAEGVTLLLVVD